MKALRAVTQATKIGDTAQAARNHAKEEVDFVRFRAADAQVRLVASDDVRRDAAVVRDALAGGTGTLHCQVPVRHDGLSRA